MITRNDAGYWRENKNAADSITCRLMRVRVGKCTCMYVGVCKCIRMYVRVCACVRVGMYIGACVFAYTYQHIYIM